MSFYFRAVMNLYPGTPLAVYDNFLHGHLLPMMRIVDLECTADDGDHDFPGMFQVHL
jgi:hypothetical protein